MATIVATHPQEVHGMQVSYNLSNASYTSVVRVVTAPRGSWKYQDAFRRQLYRPVLKASGGYMWELYTCGEKFAKCKYNTGLWQGVPAGSLHHKPAHVAGVDDFGSLFFTA